MTWYSPSHVRGLFYHILAIDHLYDQVRKLVVQGGGGIS